MGLKLSRGGISRHFLCDHDLQRCLPFSMNFERHTECVKLHQIDKKTFGFFVCCVYCLSLFFMSVFLICCADVNQNW